MSNDILQTLACYKKISHFKNSSLKRQRLEAQIIAYYKLLICAKANNMAMKIHPPILKEEFEQIGWIALFSDIIPKLDLKRKSIHSYINYAVYNRMQDYVRKTNKYRNERGLITNTGIKTTAIGERIIASEPIIPSTYTPDYFIRFIRCNIDRVVFLLYFKYGYERKYISAITGFSYDKVWEIITRLPKMLRAKLQARGTPLNESCL